MTNQTNAITFTLNQTQKLSEAMVGADLAEESKVTAFKALKRKVAKVDDIPRAREAFQDSAVIYAANKYGFDVEVFVPAFMNLKGDEKIGGKGLPMRTMRDLVHKTRNRWMGYYKKYLLEGVIERVGGKAGTKKRATKGAVVIGKADNKPADTAELNQAPETTPLKRAIENVSSIPRTVLMSTNWDAANEGLRQSIEEKTQELVALLQQVK
jgi:hypothetical protein